MSCLLFELILVKINVQIIFKTFLDVTLVLDMVSNILGSHTLLVQSLMDLCFQVPIVLSNNSSIFCNTFRNSLCYVSVKCWNLFFINLFKYAFPYLASKIKHNNLVEVRNCSDLCISSD